VTSDLVPARALAVLALLAFVLAAVLTAGVVAMVGAGRTAPHRRVPRVGGVALVLATTIALAVAASYDPARAAAFVGDGRMLLGVAVGAVSLLAVGIVDDVRGVRPSTKLVVQVAAAAAALWGGVGPRALAIGGSVVALDAWAAGVLALLWIVGVTNAMNLIDGLDGLAGGLGLIAAGAILVASMGLGHAGVGVTCAALAGALGGFLVHNRHPARVFLGDAGSLVLGYVLALLGLVGARGADDGVLVVVPLGALAIPQLDASLTIVRRLLRRAPLFRGDARHVHHRLVELGLAPRAAVRLLHAAAAVVAALATVTATATLPVTVPWIATALLVGYGVYRLDYAELAEAVRTPIAAIVTPGLALRDRIARRDVAPLAEPGE
jgi:UDP-GlcNAc:undecaprenyl-phosphate GlcNAc-1-phosphate transferase